MPKRRSDHDHSSDRRTYAAEEAAADARSASGWGFSPAANVRADPSTLASRRLVRVRGGADVRSKKHRRQAQLREFQALNSEFAEWAENLARKKLLATPPPAAGDTTTPVHFFLAAAEDYRRRAAAIRERYVLTHGDVFTFGNGDMGQLGIPDPESAEDTLNEASRPKLVRSLRDRKIVDLSLGGIHCVAVQEDGEVYTWGANDEGQLGQYRFVRPSGESDPADFPNYVEQVHTSIIPAKITGFSPSRSSPTYPPEHDPNTDEAIVMASSGACHSICLSTTGNVYFFGCYKDGEGKSWRDPIPPDETRAAQEKTNEDVEVARYVHQNKDEPRKAGEEPLEQEAAFLKRNSPAPKGKQLWPSHVYRLPKPAKFIASGGSFNVAHLTDGSVVTWGVGDLGELGRPVRKSHDKETGKYYLDVIEHEHMRPLPPLFENPNVKRTVETVACGGWHLFVVAAGEDASGLAVYSSGLNQYGQLGHGDTENRSKLTRIEALNDLNISQVAGGQHHSLVLDGSGRNLYAFGRGDSGQLGITDDSPSPGYFEAEPVSVFLEYDKNALVQAEQPSMQSISCGENHNLVVTEGGELYTWGFGEAAALGHGDDNDRYRPQKVQFRRKKGQNPPKPLPIVRRADGGGQSSGILVTISE